MSRLRHYRVDWHVILIMAFALLLGASLRLIHLGRAPLWFDEAYSVMLSSKSSFEVLLNYVGPLYLFFLKGWIGFFGQSEAWLRIPSALFDIISLCVIGRLGMTLLGSLAGAYGALIYALALFPLLWAREVRYYAPMTLFALLSLTSFVQYRQGFKRKDLLLAMLSFVVAFNCHPSTAAIPLAFLATRFLAPFPLAEKKFRLQEGVLFLIPWAVFLPYFFIVLTPQALLARVKLPDLPVTPMLTMVANFFSSALTGGTKIGHGGLGMAMPEELLGFQQAVFWLLLCLTVVGLAAIIKARKAEDKLTLSQQRSGFVLVILLSWLVLPLLANLVCSRYFPALALARYLLYAAPPLYLMAGAGLAAIPYRSIQLALAGLLVVLMLYCTPALWQDRGPSWPDIAKRAESWRTAHTAIVFLPIDQILPFFFYAQQDDPTALSNLSHEGQVISDNLSYNITRNFRKGPWLCLQASALRLDDCSPSAQCAEISSLQHIILVASPDWVGSEQYFQTLEILSGHFSLEQVLYYPYDGVSLQRYSLLKEGRQVEQSGGGL